MAIQFPCPACRQPIEIDDEWAAKPVSCPYCQKMVTAPESSTLMPAAGPAWGAPGSPPVDQGVPDPAAIPAEVPKANPIAGVALILSCAALGALIVGRILLWLYSEEMEELEALVDPSAGFAERQRSMFEYVEVQGGIPAWMMVISLLFFASILLWLAALICGLLGLRRPRQRMSTVVSLAIVGVLPILMCCMG